MLKEKLEKKKLKKTKSKQVNQKNCDQIKSDFSLKFPFYLSNKQNNMSVSGLRLY